jgi:transposase
MALPETSLKLLNWSLGSRATYSAILNGRRVATRYDKLAANYLAFIQLASIRLWLRAL